MGWVMLLGGTILSALRLLELIPIPSMTAITRGTIAIEILISVGIVYVVGGYWIGSLPLSWDIEAIVYTIAFLGFAVVSILSNVIFWVVKNKNKKEDDSI